MSAVTVWEAVGKAAAAAGVVEALLEAEVEGDVERAEAAWLDESEMVEEVDGMAEVAGEMGQGVEEVDVEVGHIHPNNHRTLHNLIG